MANSENNLPPIFQIDPRTYPTKGAIVGVLITMLITSFLMPERFLLTPLFGLISGWFTGWWLRIRQTGNEPNRRGLPSGWVLCAGNAVFYLVTFLSISIPTGIIVLVSSYLSLHVLLFAPAIIRECITIISVLLTLSVIIIGIGLGKISERQLIYWLGNEDKWSPRRKRKSKPKNDE